MAKLWAFGEFNMADIQLILSYKYFGTTSVTEGEVAHVKPVYVVWACIT